MQKSIFCLKNSEAAIVGVLWKKASNFVRKRLQYCKVFIKTYFKNYLWTAASKNQRLSDKFRSSRPEVFLKNLFLEISQNSQENTCARVSFLIKLQAWHSGTDVSLWVLWNFYEQLFSWNTSGGCFCYDEMILSCNMFCQTHEQCHKIITKKL